MKRLKEGIVGTIIIFTMLGGFLAMVTPGPQVVTSDVKLAGHTTPITIAFWWAVQWLFLSGGGTGTNPMPKPSSGAG